MSLYSIALKSAREKLESYKTTQCPVLTKDQEMTMRVMIADAWLCGHDYAIAAAPELSERCAKAEATLDDIAVMAVTLDAARRWALTWRTRH